VTLSPLEGFQEIYEGLASLVPSGHSDFPVNFKPALGHGSAPVPSQALAHEKPTPLSVSSPNLTSSLARKSLIDLRPVSPRETPIFDYLKLCGLPPLGPHPDRREFVPNRRCQRGQHFLMQFCHSGLPLITSGAQSRHF
jgi:hypothetical protein